MIEDIEVERANDFIRDNADAYAQAKGNRIYLEQFRKSKKAILIQDCGLKTGLEKESFAYAHIDYQQLLEGLKQAVIEEEKLKWLFVAAQAKIEVWRTQQANSRRGV